MGWSTKKTRSNPKKNSKKYVGLGNWVGMVSKNEKPININGFQVKPDSYQNNPLTQ